MIERTKTTQWKYGLNVKMCRDMLLEEHFMLLSNSVTCVGNLIGFNSGGYKALSRSLNIQVLFIEITLFIPRRCFERAAEECYDDSLSSIVASCSWDKHVAVGTGSQFDVLWDWKKVELDQLNKDNPVQKHRLGFIQTKGCLQLSTYSQQCWWNQF